MLTKNISFITKYFERTRNSKEINYYHHYHINNRAERNFRLSNNA